MGVSTYSNFRKVMTLFVVSFFVVVSLTTYAQECSESQLSQLLNIKTDNLTTKSIGDIFSESERESKVDIYLINNKLVMFQIEYYGEQSTTTIKYWPSTVDSFVAEYKEGYYSLNDTNVIAQKIGNLFFVCKGLFVNRKMIDGYESIKYPNLSQETTLRLYKEITNKLATLNYSIKKSNN